MESGRDGMNIIERLEAIAMGAQEWEEPTTTARAATQSTPAVRRLKEIRIEIGSIVAAIRKGPSEGAILAAEQAYHDAPEASAQVDGIADAIRAAWAVDLAQENQVEF
jgi:hypothetical protein